mgnify:CR=1 FL=1
MIPNLLVDGVADTIRASHAQKFYICNIMTQDGETEGYTAADHLEALQRHGREGIVDLCLANNAPIPRGLAARYSEEDAELLRVDRERIAELGIALAEYPLLSAQATPAMTRRCWRRRSWSSTASARCASTAAPSSTLRKNRSGNNAQQ